MFKTKSSKLIFGLLFDLMGMASYLVPFIGEFTDIMWAPVAGYLMTQVYPGKTGKTSGVLTMIEELIPGLDIIPTFTLTWIYTYVVKKQDTLSSESNTIDV